MNLSSLFQLNAVVEPPGNGGAGHAVPDRKNTRGCPHILVRKGYYLGLKTEDYICVECGAGGRGPDWPARLNRLSGAEKSP